LDPTLGAAMKSALQVLDHAPYASTEQLITHFLPNLVTLRALQNIGLGDPNMENRLEQTLQESLQTLLSRQNSDGGWGWWKGLRSDQYLTAYALYALSQARESGASVSQASIDSAIQYLQAGLAQPGMLSDPTLFNRQSFVLYALASAGEGNPALALQMVAEREGLSLYARALLANTLAISNPDAPQIQTLLADLETNVVRSATGAHWQDEITDRFNLGSPVRTTAHALQALLTIDPENPLIPNTLRWLFAARSHDGTWRSSHETAWALISIADWLETSGSLQAAYQYSMRLNGQQIASGSASPEAQFTAIETTTPIEDLFSDQPNQLSIRRDAGGGSLFYTAHLTVYRPVEDIIPTSRGLSISHQYFRFDGDCGAVDNPCPAAETAHVGDDLLVRVTLVLPSDQYYLAVEDSFPAGVEPIDTSLRTTPSEDVIPNLGADLSEQGGWRWWYFSHAELGDNRLRLFADFLPAGTYQYTYLVHALLPGEYRVIPPRAWAVYFPEVYGQGAGQVYTIQP
jgi:hypothetical protein